MLMLNHMNNDLKNIERKCSMEVKLSLNKAIEHGKEKRKPYSLYNFAKSVSKQCRNHGGCKWCEGNRTYKNRKREFKEEYEEKIYKC